MAFCYQCGEEIEFINNGFGAIPIHPSGSCGGRGGCGYGGAEVTRRFAQQAMEWFLSSRSSHIRATSIRTHAVQSVAQAFISINLRMAQECSSISSDRRGRSIHALTIPSFDTTFHPLKVEHEFWLLRRANPKNQTLSQPNGRRRHHLSQAPQISYHLALSHGQRLAGCPSWSQGLFLDKLGLKRKASCSYQPGMSPFRSASFSLQQIQDFTGRRESFVSVFR